MSGKEFSKVFIASDHGGWQLKQELLHNFKELPWEDLGCFDETSVNYPDFADQLCINMKEVKNSIGVLICGSGQGMAMAANKFKHIRAALCWSEEITQLAREHNNANVLCLGGRFTEPALAFKILKTFLNTPFSGGRHTARVNLFSQD